MGIMTTARECIEKAEVDLNAAIASLQRVVVDRCSGTSDYMEYKIETFRGIYFELIKQRDRLVK